MNKTVTIIIALLLVGLGVFFFYQPSTEEEATPESTLLRVGENAIFVADQMPAETVMISFVDLAEVGWVVIHENNEGKPGIIMGNSDFLSSDETRDFSINLIRASVDSEQLFAMLHKDNGDGIFNAAEDTPVIDVDDTPVIEEEGKVMFMKFFISVDAEEPSAVNL